MQRRLDVEGGQPGARDGLRTQALVVRGERDEGDAEPGRDLLDQRVRQRFDTDPAARPDQEASAPAMAWRALPVKIT